VAKLTDLRALVDAARQQAGPKAPDESTGKHRPSAAPITTAHRSGNGGLRRHIASTKHATADIDLAQAFADVTRMPARNRAVATQPRPAAIPRHRIADEQEALQLSKYGAEPSPHSWDIGQELEGEQTFLRQGLGSDILTKLRRSHWTIQGVLDLHGMTTDEAHDTLADFLVDARTRGWRCVRIIHGKGLTSPNREPVLKGKVRRWLMQWDDVLAYCEAARNAGGGGAVVVLLRGRSTTKS
jgi:DNA-nicking Smr family endonuclease